RFTAMQPGEGAVGTVVEITGEHFGIMGRQDVITFNGREALVLEATGDRYKVRVPRGASTGRVTITGYGGKALSSADFVVEELAPAEAITVYPNPSNGEFTVSLRHADFDVQLLQVHDALGKRLHQTRISGPRPEAVQIKLPTAKAGSTSCKSRRNADW
ncbi:IPT/TIG domain-containing protein, partial [Pontibacter sp. BAB1700]|uniref:IPT/TIG domain-containing protein n=1 Tax=Pontibacter sp. BAB1700 TaxID=1144253 RepID=UPI00026BCA2D